MLVVSLSAGYRTYTFTSLSWDSRVLSGTCDGVTDGWTSDKNGLDYSAGYYDAEDRPYTMGVGVTTGVSGAGATSVLSFDSVTAVTINFCQNSSKGRGVVYVQVGNHPADSLLIGRPAASGAGVYNRDSTIVLSDTLSGQVRFWVKCTENRIYINSLSIHVAGGNTDLYDGIFRRVTDVSQLKDGDVVVFAVPERGDVMTYFDEWKSKNNIKSTKGSFSHDLSLFYGTKFSLDYDEQDVYYTLYKRELNGDSVFVFSDEVHYEEAYLVASGGQTKNRLAVWNHLYDANTYGNYGYWDITITNGEASICNRGNSLGRYILCNYNNGTILFGCYQNEQLPNMTRVSLYRLSVEPIIGTAVEETVSSVVTRMLVDGQILVRRANRYYTLDGRIL